MGGHGSGRKPFKQFIPERANIAQRAGAEPFEIPNLSGDHSAGTVLTTPVNETDIANKKYVDDTAGGGAHTESSTDSLTNKTINSFTNDVHANKLHEELRNESGDTINRGDAVFISGYNIGLEIALIDLADASSSSTMPAIAICQTSALSNNATGHFIESGNITNMDTNSWNVGDVLYISETGTTGNTLTNTKPIGTALIQKMGHVLRKHATMGIIEIFGAGRANDIPNIADTKIWIGDTNGVPQEFALSGDVTMTAGGVTAIQDSSHTIVSHDTTATGANLTQLTDGSDTTLHDHDGISENTTHRGSDGSDHSLVNSAMQDLVDDTTPDLGGELDAGAHTIGFTQQSATGDGTTTIDWRLGNKFFFTFGSGNDVFTFTAPTNPCNILLVLKQFSTGGKTATWPGAVKWAGGVAPTLSTGNNDIDIISFYYDGTNYYGVESLDFS